MSKTDLTKIEKPFGLLSTEDQVRLKNCGGKYERFFDCGWIEVEDPIFLIDHTYRKKVVKKTMTYEAHCWYVVGKFGIFVSSPHLKEDTAGKATVDLVDDRPVRMVWEADE